MHTIDTPFRSADCGLTTRSAYWAVLGPAIRDTQAAEFSSAPESAMPMISRLFGGSFLLAAASSCGGGSEGFDPFGGNQPADCTPANVFCMSSLAFTPMSRVVAVNAPAIWINDSGVAHDVVFDTPEAALAVAFSGGNFQAPDKTSNHRKFAAAGSYAFHCTIHGTATSGMRGTVVVQ